MRRDPAEDGKADVAPQDLPELRRGAALVATDDDHSGDLEALGKGADARGRRGHRGPPLTCVEDQDERRVETDGDVDRPRALHALPAVEGRLHRHQEHEIAALAPGVVELQHGGIVKRRVEHPGRPALAGVQEPPQRKVGTDGDHADGALLGEARLERACGKSHGRAGLEPAHHEPGHRHERVLLSAGRAVQTAGGPRAKRTSGPRVEYLTRLTHSAEVRVEGMDLRRQLHDVLWARVLFTLALLLGVLWVQIDDHGLVTAELLVALAVVVVANVPFFLLEDRAETRALTAAIVVVDLALVTAAIIFSGGALSAVAVFYVWPIVLAAVFLPAWVPYAAAVAAGAAYAGIWELQHLGWLHATRHGGRDQRAPQLDADHGVPARSGVSAHRSAGRAAGHGPRAHHRPAQHRQSRHRRAAAAHAGHQRAAPRDERDQPRLSSPPGRGRAHARGAEADHGRLGHGAGFALVLNHNSGELDVKASAGRSTRPSFAR